MKWRTAAVVVAVAAMATALPATSQQERPFEVIRDQEFAPITSSPPRSYIRQSFGETLVPSPSPTATASPAPRVAASPQEYALDRVGSREYDCLYKLWMRESGWRWNALNKHSGAYGIPQALPGSKMAKAGADWKTNPITQVKWGLGYISGRYGSPCKAWSAFQKKGWY